MNNVLCVHIYGHFLSITHRVAVSCIIMCLCAFNMSLFHFIISLMVNNVSGSVFKILE